MMMLSPVPTILTSKSRIVTRAPISLQGPPPMEEKKGGGEREEENDQETDKWIIKTSLIVFGLGKNGVAKGLDGKKGRGTPKSILTRRAPKR